MPEINSLADFDAVFTTASDNPSDKAMAYAWPGGYPIYYLTHDGECFCPSCVTKERERIAESIVDKSNDGWRIIAYDVNWEDETMYCANCSKQIESAYGDGETNKGEN